jgi:hypothetical protein
MLGVADEATVERDRYVSAAFQCCLHVLERNTPPRSLALCGALPLGIIEEDLPHGPECNGQEVRPAHPPWRRLVDQPEVRLVDEGGGIEGLLALPVPPLAVGELTKLVVDQGSNPSTA